MQFFFFFYYFKFQKQEKYFQLPKPRNMHKKRRTSPYKWRLSL